MTLKHGASRRGAMTPEYKVWVGIRKRIFDTRCRIYPHYGGRGIQLCERWLSFAAFLEDVGPRPGADFWIERIDNDGHYEPSNVRWASIKEQTRNRRSTRWVEYNGEKLSVAEWSERLGHGPAGKTPYKRFWTQLKKAGWDLSALLEAA